MEGRVKNGTINENVNKERLLIFLRSVEDLKDSCRRVRGVIYSQQISSTDDDKDYPSDGVGLALGNVTSALVTPNP